MKKADRNINNLESNFRLKVIDFLKETWDRIFITEAYRSQARQNFLFTQWRTRPGSIITWTRNSMHTKGLAFDIAFKWKTLYPNNLKLWKEIWKIANSYWIDWGYDLWGRDLPHFQCNQKPYKQTGKYRKIAGQSVINNPTNLIKTIRTGTADEAVACIEIIVNRKI